MDLVSSHLHHFLIDHFSEFSSKKPNSPFFSTLSRTFLSTLFQNIHQAHILWEYHYKDILHLEDPSTRKKNEDEHESNYKNNNLYLHIPEEIRKKYIESKPREKIFQNKYSIPIGNRVFHVYVWFPITIASSPNHHKTTVLMSHNQIQEKILFILQKIYTWLHIACSYLPKNQKCSQTVDIYLFLTEHKKTMPSILDMKIDEIHVNTAFTTGCIQKNTSIFVFREEEWFKVLMHETFHTLGLDFIDIDHPTINDTIRRIFPITVPDIRAYEVYAEMWAEIMNTLFVVYETDPPARKGRLPMIRWMATLERAFILEQTFSLFQVNKVLYSQRLKYPDLFLASTAAKYQEETYIFSYFILKSIWMFHVNSFLEFCAKQPDGISLKFQLSAKNLDTFLLHLATFSRSERYLSEMEKIHQLSIPLLDKKKKNDFIANTLRMTVLELHG